MKKRRIIIAIIIATVLIGVVVAGPIMSDVEKPQYQIIESKDNIEIRQYAPMIIAEVEVNGQAKDAIKDGFRLLADYIFGNNVVNQNIAMTAPVQQQESVKIAMTAPVQQQSTGDSWKISFVMPSKYNMNTLPKPRNERVVLKELATKQFVVIVFSGRNSDKNIKQHQDKLMEYIQSQKISVTGFPKYAFYNPPWTLPYLRRNEVMIEIQ